MSYATTLFDDFNDNSFNTTLWARTSSSTAVESGAKITVTPDPSTSQWLLTKSTFDLTNGNLFGFQVTKSGTAGTDTEVFIGVSDSATPNAGNRASFKSTGPSGTMASDAQGSTTISGYTNIGTPAGISATGWVAGTWYAVGSWASDNILHLYKSSDGQTWTEMAHMTFGGTFAARTAGRIFVSAGDFSGVSGYTFSVDNATLFTPSTTHGKVRNGGAWVVPTNVKVRSGSAWVVPTATKVRSGGAWVTPTN